MSTLEDKIKTLETELEEYVSLPLAEREQWKEVITTRSATLNRLLDAQAAASAQAIAPPAVVATAEHVRQRRWEKLNEVLDSNKKVATAEHVRKRRWEKLNEVLDSNKKGKLRVDGQRTLGYSYASWDQVQSFFDVRCGTLDTASKGGIPHSLLNALCEYLSFATICFGSISEGREPKRIHFIVPIIITVCSFFNGEVQILADEDLEGDRVHAHGHFEFVLKRRDKRICIVEAKKDDILEGKTQSLIGCESLCDIDDLSVSYGIVTNILEWCFLKNEADMVTEEMLTIWLEENRPNLRSLEVIANKIIAILE